MSHQQQSDAPFFVEIVMESLDGFLFDVFVALHFGVRWVAIES
jgi:hypothetical protein